MRFCSAILLTLVLAVSLAAQGAKSGDVLPFKATETTLANGLRVIVVPTGFPNIVAIHEIGETGGVHFMCMEWVQGTTLSDLIQRRSLPLDQALTYAYLFADQSGFPACR